MGTRQTSLEYEPLSPSPHATKAGHRPLTVALALGAMVVLPLVGWATLRANSDGLAAPAEQAAEVRRVHVVTPGRSASVNLTLPANIDAFQTTLIYSRVSGYLLRWYADIGQSVKAGQKLAEIDTPELDQELEQARAILAQGRAEIESARAELKQAQAAVYQADADIARAKANLEYARSVRRRAESLIPSHAISEVDLDETRRDADARQAEVAAADAQRKTREAAVTTATARVTSREATVNSMEASVRRLERLQAFKTIAAPFEGVVTRRRAEIGILVTAGSASTSPELFAIAQTSSLRIRINVPQSMATSIQTGQKAQILVPEWPDRVFTATVARTSQAIDPTSRTLTVELDLSNEDHALLPGTFAQVVLPVHRASPVHTVPSIALLNRPDGLRVAVVGADGSVRLARVKLGRDYGSSVEVLTGLAGGERVVVNPPDDLAENERVTIADAREGESSPGAAQAAQVGSRKGGA